MKKTKLTSRQRELFRVNIFGVAAPQSPKIKRRACNRAKKARILSPEEVAAVAEDMGLVVKSTQVRPAVQPVDHRAIRAMLRRACKDFAPLPVKLWLTETVTQI